MGAAKYCRGHIGQRATIRQFAGAGTERDLSCGYVGVQCGDPNGTWSLFVADHETGDVGDIEGGWSLSLTMISPVNQLADLVLAGTATPNPVLAGEALTIFFSRSRIVGQMRDVCGVHK